MARKPNFIRKKKRKVHGATFWDQEYTNPEHLKLSTAPSEDLAKFTRWIERQGNKEILNPEAGVVDAGCGNGRNLIYLARLFGMKGVGVDISSAAIAQARRASTDLSITYHVGSAGAPLPAEDESQSLALDMMTSHFLNKEERLRLRDEFHRVLKPGGFLFMKTFLKDEDLHTARLLKDHPGEEPGSYIHPVMGVAEYVYSEEELTAFLGEKFLIRKIYRSHRHKGRAAKRRTISIYAEKDYGRNR
ncbi:MAG TPA: methyltransferase domain-containing protein [Candidatus Paceibacterota bacterium]